MQSVKISRRALRSAAPFHRASPLLAVLLAAACSAPAGSPPPVPPPDAPAPPVATAPDVFLDPPPPVAREFRGVWVASVSNIDWPSRPGLPVDRQKSELVAILDRAKELGLNAVIFQVRPAGDALYASELEPWSEYLTGTQGRAPEPYYDPLEFAVAEAHRRGLELHAWFNPYRARHPSARTPESPKHLARTRPELVRKYGRHLWMDPGEPEVLDHSIRVVLDVVRRYDVDGVHIDDYFYPYRERDARGREVAFPDGPSWTRYVRSGGRLARDDWRRDNVDRFVERLYADVKREKPWVKVGISPFGIWRPGHPAQVTGLDAYSQIYGDARKWILNGWADYFTPQLYWPVAQTAQSYPVLLRWWSEQNAHGRHLWPGNFTSRVVTGGTRLWPAAEILEQIAATRGDGGAGGNVHFSMRAFLQSRDSLAEKLATQAYAEPALVPASPWLGNGAPAAPRVEARAAASGAEIALEPGMDAEPRWWLVRSRSGDEWRAEVLPGSARTHAVPAARGGAVPAEVWVSAVDRMGNEGPPAAVRLPQR